MAATEKSGSTIRVSLTGRISIQAGGTTVDEQRFPGRQGRLVFAYLVAAGARPVPRDELAEALWGDELPATWEKALVVLMSKLRGLLGECGIDGAQALTSAFGCYQLQLPEGTWVDVDAAAGSVESAERSLAAGEAVSAASLASEACVVVRRPFLPGEDGHWVDERRRGLAEVLMRGLACLAEASLSAGKPEEAVRAAEELTGLEPFRESGWRLLMRANVAAGNHAEALRVYERCRRLLADELGSYPSPETESEYLTILRTTPGTKPAVDEPHSESRPALLRGRRRRAAAVAGVAAAVVGLGSFLATRSPSQPVIARIGPSAGTARVALLLEEPLGAAPRSTFADAQLEGLRLAETKLGVTTKVVSAGPTSDTTKRTVEALVDQGYGLILVSGGVDAGLASLLHRRPRTRFVFVDSSLGVLHGRANATGLVFDDQAAGYLAGYLSGLMERSDRRHVVSAVGGVATPAVRSLIDGFDRGVSAALPGAVVRTAYSDVFDREAPCARIASRQIDSGSRVVFAPAGQCGFGALSVAGLRGVWAVGVDEDVSYLGPQILASAVKRFDRAVFLAVLWYTEGRLPSGRDVVLGLRDNAVGLAGINPRVPQAIRTRLAGEVTRLLQAPEHHDEVSIPPTTRPEPPTSAFPGTYGLVVSKHDVDASSKPDGLAGTWVWRLDQSGTYDFTGTFEVRGTYRVSGDRLTIVETQGYCPGVPGVFRLRVGDGRLKLTTIRDDCSHGLRGWQMSEHPWTRVG
jgi:basic membrane lipoprotein Med (substrate-binding protein (PBP1-ABC) superfamily)/DNA-binding SARP family transcriptional activator